MYTFEVKMKDRLTVCINEKGKRDTGRKKSNAKIKENRLPLLVLVPIRIYVQGKRVGKRTR
jgi:hypothetical protein